MYFSNALFPANWIVPVWPCSVFLWFWPVGEREGRKLHGGYQLVSEGWSTCQGCETGYEQRGGCVGRQGKEGTSQLPHLEKFILNFSSLLFVIRVNLPHPQSSFFLYGLLSRKCFSVLVSYNYFQVSFYFKVICTWQKSQNRVTKLHTEFTGRLWYRG